MKKLIALMVALLMVVLPVATAETVFTISNPVLTVNDNTYNLSAWNAKIAAGEIGDIDAYHIVLSNGSVSLAIEVNVVGDKAYAMVNGNVYSLPLPSDSNANKVLSESEKASLGIDVEALINNLMSYATVDGNTIRVPYTALNDFLDGMVPVLNNAGGTGVDVSSLKDLVNRAKKNNSGVNLEGTFVDSGNGSELSVKGTVVRNGVANAAPAFGLDVSADDSSVSVNLDAAARGNARFSITGDTMSAAISAKGKTLSASAAYSVSEDDVNLVAIDTTNAVDARNIKGKILNILKSSEAGKAFNSSTSFLNSLIGAIVAAA